MLKRWMQMLPVLLALLLAAGPAFAVSFAPNPIIATGSATTLTLTGVGTSWVNGTTVFSLSGVSGASITSQSVSNATTATITVNGGSNIGTATISDNTDAATSNLYIVQWQLAISDTFGRPNTTAGSAASTSGVLNAWTDQAGGIFSIQSTKLNVSPSASNPYKTNFLIRPIAESSQDQRIDVYYTANASLTPEPFGAARWQSGNNAYIGGPSEFAPGVSAQINFYRFFGGTLNTLNLTTGTGTNALAGASIITGHQYRFSYQAVGVNPTIWRISTFDVTASSSVQDGYVSDSTATALQGSGQPGYDANYFGTSAAFQIDRIDVFYNSAAGLTLSPNNLSLSGGTGSIAVTGTDTAFSGTPFTLTNEGGSNASLSSQTVSSGTAATLSVAPGSTPNAALITDSVSGAHAVLQLLGAAITPSPVQVTVGGGNQTITLTGTATSWTPGSPGSPTFTLTGSNGATGYSIVSQTVASTTSATITINPGTAGGTLTITDPSTGSTAIVRDMFLITPTDTNLFASPYTWWSDGSGSLQTNNVRASSTVIKTTGVGSYIKLGWTGTDIQILPAVNLTSGAIRYAIDTSPMQDLGAATSGVATSLATGLTQGSHTLYLVYNVDNGSGSDRWNTPTDYVAITGFYVNGASAAPTLNSKRAILFWDSYGEGKSIGGPTGTTTVADHTQSAVPGLMNYLGVEYGAVVYAGLGYTVAGLDNVVPVYTPSNDAQTSWNKFWAGQYRLYSSGTPSSSGMYSPAPDYIISLHGTNDKSSSDATVTAAVTGWLTAQRAVAPNAQILVCISPNGSKTSAVTAGFAAYQTATPDSKAHLINIGVQPGLAGAGSPTTQSADGLHPRSNENVVLSSLYAAAIQAATTPAGTSNRGIHAGGRLSFQTAPAMIFETMEHIFQRRTY